MTRKKQKKQFYDFFDLSDDHRLVTHINSKNGKLENSYTIEFTYKNINFSAWIQLYNEEKIYEFFCTHKDFVIIGAENTKFNYYREKWQGNINKFIKDLLLFEQGYVCLISLNQEPPTEGVVHPIQKDFISHLLLNSQELPPSWMSPYDIGKTQEFYRSINKMLN